MLRSKPLEISTALFLWYPHPVCLQILRLKRKYNQSIYSQTTSLQSPWSRPPPSVTWITALAFKLLLVALSLTRIKATVFIFFFLSHCLYNDLVTFTPVICLPSSTLSSVSFCCSHTGCLLLPWIHQAHSYLRILALAISLPGTYALLHLPGSPASLPSSVFLPHYISVRLSLTLLKAVCKYGHVHTSTHAYTCVSLEYVGWKRVKSWKLLLGFGLGWLDKYN